MSLIESVFKSLGIEALTPLKFTARILEGKGGYFEGVKKVDLVCKDKIIFSHSDGRVLIEGSELKIVKFVDGDIAVKGEILKLEKLK